MPPKKPGKKPRRRGGGPAFTRARRDVMLSYRPYRRELKSARREGIRDFKTAQARVGNVYGALGRELAPLSGQYAGQMAGIRGNLTSDLGGLADLIGSNVAGVPQSEIGAGANMFGTLGAGGLSQLASQQARNVGYNTSAQRQGGIEQMVAKRNYGIDLQNFLGDLRKERLGAAQDIPQLIRQRMDEIRDRSFDRSMALREFGLRSRAAGLDERIANLGIQSSNQLGSLLGGLSPEEIARLFG